MPENSFAPTAFKPQKPGITWCPAVASVAFPFAEASAEMSCCLVEGHENDHVNICGDITAMPPVTIETRWRDD